MNRMKLLSKQKPLGFVSLHRLAEICRVALANHTPTGPGSLATGQAGARGSLGPYLGRVAHKHRERGPCSRVFIDFQSPKEQAV